MEDDMPEPSGSTKYITVKELMAKYKISTTKAYELVRADGCPIVRLGNAIRVDEALFDRWLKNDYDKAPYVDRRYKRGSSKNPENLFEMRKRDETKRVFNMRKRR
jgi:excisionase family DNA binding protein